MALPKLPETTKVLGEEFRIEVPETLLDEDGEELYGDTDGIRRRFRVAGEQGSVRIWTTFLHEYLHGVLYVNGVANVISEELQEIIVQSMEHGFIQFMDQHGDILMRAVREGKKK